MTHHSACALSHWLGQEPLASRVLRAARRLPVSSPRVSYDRWSSIYAPRLIVSPKASASINNRFAKRCSADCAPRARSHRSSDRVVWDECDRRPAMARCPCTNRVPGLWRRPVPHPGCRGTRAYYRLKDGPFTPSLARHYAKSGRGYPKRCGVP